MLRGNNRMLKLSKRITAIMLCSAVSVSMLSGCQKAADTSSKTTDAKTSETSNVKPTLKELLIYSKIDYNTMPLAKDLAAKSGYTVQYDMLPATGAVDKLNLLMSSGADYDIINYNGPPDINRYIKSGLVADLTPLIEKYGPNIKESMSARTLERTQVDKKTYMITASGVFYNWDGVAFRTDLVEKMGTKIPTTTGEFKTFLQLVKDKDPAGVGKDKNLVWTIKGPKNYLIMGAFGLAQQYVGENGKVVDKYAGQEMKDYLAYMADLYKNGLIDKEFAVAGGSSFMEKFTQGRSVVASLEWGATGYKTALETIAKTSPNVKIDYMTSLKGKDGKQGTTWEEGVPEGTVFVPKSSKNAVDAVKYINWTLDKTNNLFMNLGTEGVDYKTIAGGYEVIQPAYNTDRATSNTFNLGGREQDVKLQIFNARLGRVPMQKEAYDKINTVPDEQKIMPILFKTVIDAQAKNSVKLTKMITDEMTNIIMGGATVASWDDFYKTVLSQGGDDILKEMNVEYPKIKK